MRSAIATLVERRVVGEAEGVRRRVVLPDATVVAQERRGQVVGEEAVYFLRLMLEFPAQQVADRHAALALVELELPAWKLRRLIYEDGEWLCSFEAAESAYGA